MTLIYQQQYLWHDPNQLGFQHQLPCPLLSSEEHDVLLISYQM
jgi:hypothetical protein